MTDAGRSPTLADLADCFEGAVPAVIATASADGTPNVTYLSRVRTVDANRVALSNQFFSKTSRNLVDNPRASMLVLDARTYEQYRLTLVFERTERRGPVFERLREDVDIMAALIGLQDVFRLRSADIFRVVDIEHLEAEVHRRGEPLPEVDPGRHDGLDPGRIGELSARLGRCGHLDAVVGAALAGLDELFGYRHSILLLADEASDTLFTVAARGYEHEAVGSEVRIGEGIVGEVAARCTPIRVGDLGQVAKYAETIRRAYEAAGDEPVGHEPSVPGLTGVASQLAVPAMALGSLVGVLVVEERALQAFGEADEAVLTVVASIVGGAIDAERAREREAEAVTPTAGEVAVADPDARPCRLRFFVVDGSVFLDDEYLVKGVAGRILRTLVRAHLESGRTGFTNRELRLDPSLELPPVKDNLESRLLLLQRRLDERDTPMRIVRTGRGRFRFEVRRRLDLSVVEAPGG